MAEVYDVDEGAPVPAEAPAAGGAPAGAPAGGAEGAPADAPPKTPGRKAAKRKRAEERAAAKAVAATAAAEAILADILRPSDSESDGGNGGGGDSSDGSSGSSAAVRRRLRRQRQQQSGSPSGAAAAGRRGDDSDGDGAYGPLRYTAAPGGDAYLDALMTETPAEEGRAAAAVATALAAARKAMAGDAAAVGDAPGEEGGASAGGGGRVPSTKRRRVALPDLGEFLSLDTDEPADAAGVAAAAATAADAVTSSPPLSGSRRARRAAAAAAAADTAAAASTIANVEAPIDVDNPDWEDGELPSDGVSAAAAAAALADDDPWDDSTMPPWITDRDGADAVAYARSPTVSLHYEVLQFANFMAPTTAEEAAREALVATLRRVIGQLWPSAKVELFGSYATRLYLPTSDVDVCVMGAPEDARGRDMLETVASALRRVPGLVRTLRVIRARVPLVKLTDAASGVACDISFNQPNGPTNVPVIRRYLHAYPALHPLLLVVKAFLHQRGLNEVFSGGLGSYSVLLLVVSHLQTLRFNFPSGAADLGDALVTFFTLYGRLFNVAFASIAVGDTPAPGYRVKSRRWAPADGDTLRYSLEDPNDRGNELGRNSYAAARIRKVFAAAAAALGGWRRTGATAEHPTPLSTILFADPQMVKRREVVRLDRE